MSPLLGWLADTLLELQKKKKNKKKKKKENQKGEDMRLGSMRGVAKSSSSSFFEFTSPKVGTVIGFGGGVCSASRLG